MRRKKVLYSSPFIPAEWISAHGLVPSRKACVQNDPGMPVDVVAGVCPYMRSFVNHASGDSDVLSIILTTMCDQMRRGYDFVVQRTGVPCFLLHIPSSWQTAGVHRLYRRELERLGEFLVSLGGSVPESGRLAAVMLDYDRKRRMLADQGKLTDRQFAEALSRFHETGELPEDREDSGLAAKKIPLGFVGGPLTEYHFDVFDIFNQLGARIAVNGTETGVRTLPARFDRRRLMHDTMDVLSGSYFGTIPEVAERPNDRIFTWVNKEIADHGLRGMVLFRYTWCDKWHGEVQRFREALPVPLLDIELSGERIDERTKNRIQAFMEVLS